MIPLRQHKTECVDLTGIALDCEISLEYLFGFNPAGARLRLVRLTSRLKHEGFGTPRNSEPQSVTGTTPDWHPSPKLQRHQRDVGPAI
ncbi:hypothetical protein AVEN_120063-1 [Araneus ventricosus]|uniref:Uncharacterized protein n=1 Tax=Araneus ventricosus TaxID=182803 RepID=A0A4Y2JLE5_ARAVE|nr:hypothetical protein AVEN_120063-1 [Araneus ventricosus]